MLAGDHRPSPGNAGDPDRSEAWSSRAHSSLTQGTIAEGGDRYEANLVAKYMFQTGQGTTAYDTSGVTPAADLALSGNVTWAGGWGITFGAGGKAQAATSASQKIANMIQASGEYSIEAWVAPANVTQANAYIVSYSGSNTTRDATLGQDVTQYEGFARSSVTDTNGNPPLITATDGGAAQAALQHVVLTYDPVNGQKLYVNGMFTGDADPPRADRWPTGIPPSPWCSATRPPGSVSGWARSSSSPSTAAP